MNHYSSYAQPRTPAPTFEEARNRRQRVRSAGLHPDYWYPVEQESALKAKPREFTFWKRSFVLFRGQGGQIHALENRCAHRQLKLSLGQVEAGQLVCPYHGWCFNGSGRVVHMKHDLFGHSMPKLGVHSLPVQVRYGLIWVFPGDPELASQRPIPTIPELEGDTPWACVPVDFTWKAHHSMIIDNVSDFTHAYLHRRFRPFEDAKLTRLEAQGDKVFLEYDTAVGRGRISGLFVDRKRINTNHMELCYEYPFQWSNTGNRIKHHLFVLPVDERTTRAFFLFYFDSLKIPFVDVHIPQRLMNPLLQVANKLLVAPLLAEDGMAVEAEQLGYEAHHEAPIAELNPAVTQFQALTIRKWEEYLAKARS